ncbi:YhdP family protein [Thalassotalea crassostreae]|uniref:YhdP family protein n=1 Tax=Thalassotalea crassostreae TaxID=1763536 RepID=UPI000839A32D|nr:YhdP family protein [Thalassotalea crassostreae]
MKKTFWAYTNTWLNRLYKTLAVLLVITAVLLTSARIFLPYADSFKTEIEDYINEKYHGDIAIGSLTAGWYKFGPTLVIRDVILSDSEAFNVVVDNVEFGIDFWSTIKQQKIITSNVMLVGVEMFVDHDLMLNGEQEATIEEQSETEIDVRAFSELMLQQVKRFSVIDANILLKSPNKERKIKLTKLAWHNDDLKHRAIGKLNFVGFSSKSLRLIVDLSGAEYDELIGKIYLEGNNLDITPVLDRALAEKADQLDSSINFRSWINILDGQATDAHINFDNSQLIWHSIEKQHALMIPKGRASIYPEKDNSGFTLVSSPIQFSYNDTPWQPITVQTKADENGFVSNVSGINLNDVWQLFPIVVDNVESATDYTGLNLSGDLVDVQLQYANKELKIKSDFKDLSIDHANGIPGVDNVSGKLLFDGDTVDLKITAVNGALDFDSGFSRPIPYQNLAADVNLELAEHQWLLKVKDISLQSEELSVVGDVQYLQEKEKSGVLSLFAYVDRANASKTQYYLPLPIMSSSLVEYLTGAIFSGEVQQAAVVVNGPMDTFPYLDRSGIFIVDADIRKAKYQFEPSWPAITDATANLNFTNDSMVITAYDGDLVGLPVKDVVVGIETFSGESILTVRSDVLGKAKTLQALMLASPLANSVGKTIEMLGPEGQITGTFALDVPLADTDKTVAEGLIKLDNNVVNLSTPEMTFTNARGELRFVNELITTKDLTLDWRGLPLAIDVKGSVNDELYQVDIGIDGSWARPHYIKEMPEQLQSYVNGHLNWHGDLSIFVPSASDESEQGEQSDNSAELTYHLELTSDLLNAELLLPEPYEKQLNEKAMLKAVVEGSALTSSIKANIDDNLHFFGQLDHQKVSFTRSQLTLGKEKMLLPSDGFHITANLDRIEYSKWQGLLSDIIGSLPNDKDAKANSSAEQSAGLMPVPERIRGDIKQVDFYGSVINDVDFNLLSRPEFWLLQVNGDEVRSRLKFYNDFEMQGIDIDADFIHLNASASEEVADTNEQSSDGDNVEVADIPKVSFICDSCKYGKIDFGAVNIEIENTSSNLVTLKQLTAKRKGAELSMTGSWKKDNIHNQTQLTAQLKADDVEKELKRMGYPASIKESDFKSNADISWQGAPWTFDLASMNGSLKTRLRNGSLAEVSDKGARIFSIFSFQSLVRKLQLDFRDIFSEGMFFNEISAEFNVVNGVAYTDNLKMDGVAGNLTVKGNTQLVSQRLDYKMQFAPKVTSSLPVIVGWLVNPVLGAAILVADKAIEQAEVISVINFELTGTVDEPIFKEVNRKSRNVNVGKSKPTESDKKTTIDPLEQEIEEREKQELPVEGGG